MTRSRDAATNSHVATFVHPTGAGNQHVPAAGATGQLLQYASAGTAAWATISTGADQIVSPTFASPDSTFTSSGTYSKPASVADDDYMWVFIVNGGGGGGNDNYAGYNAQGGTGGNPLLLYGKASHFHNSTYVIGAGGASNTDAGGSPSVGGTSSLTLHASQGGAVYTPSTSNFTHYVGGGSVAIGGTTLFGAFTGGNQFTLDTVHSGWASNNTSGLYVNQGGLGGNNTFPKNSVFGGGGGGGAQSSFVANVAKFGGSFLSGSGGAGSNTGAGTAGALHGGGGGSGKTSSGAGGSGSMRVYYV